MEAFSTRERRKIIALYQQGWDTEDIAPQFGASPAGVRIIDASSMAPQRANPRSVPAPCQMSRAVVCSARLFRGSCR